MAFKRSIHFLNWQQGSLLLRWHRWRDGAALPPGYTGQVLMTAGDWTGAHGGDKGLWEAAISKIERGAERIVRDHEESTWAALGVDGLALTKVHVQWSGAQSDYPEAAEDNPPNLEINWHRTKGGVALPSYCDGVLLYESGPGIGYYSVNTSKGVVTARVAELARSIMDILRAAQPLVDHLERRVGWD